MRCVVKVRHLSIRSGNQVLPLTDSTTDVIFGTHPIAAALAFGSREFINARVALGGDTDGSLSAWMRARRIIVSRGERASLDTLSRGGVHQGVVARVHPLEIPELAAGTAPSDMVFTSPSRIPLLIALDGVTDPQNVGAVLRSALLLDADGMLLPLRGGPPLSGTVSKASAGALEAWAASGGLWATRGALAGWLGAARAAGWRVLGAAGDDRTGITPRLPFSQLTRNTPTILVLGAEGAGLKNAVRDTCDALIALPTPGLSRVTLLAAQTRKRLEMATTNTTTTTNTSTIPLPILPLPDSLNVSVAAALLIQKLAHL